MSKVGEINFIVTADNSKYRRKMAETLSESKKLYDSLKSFQGEYTDESLKGIKDIGKEQLNIIKELEKSGKKASKVLSSSIKSLSGDFAKAANEASSLKDSLNGIESLKMPQITGGSITNTLPIGGAPKPQLTPLKDVPLMPNMTKLTEIPFKPTLDPGGIKEIDSLFKSLKDKTMSLSGNVSDTIRSNISLLGNEYKALINVIGGEILAAFGRVASASFLAFTSVGVKSAKDFEKITAQMVKRAGWTKDQVKGISKEIGEAYKAGFDVEDIASSFSNLSVSLKLHGEDLGLLSNQYLKFSKVTGESLDSLVDTGARAMKGWEIPKAEWDEFLNYMLRTSQETGIEAGQALNLISTFSDPLSLLGFDWDEAAALAGSLYSSGANIEGIMGAMRLAASSLSEAGVEDMRGTFEWVIEDIKQSDIADAMEKAGSIFGSRVAADMVKAIKRGDFDLDELLQDIDLNDADIDKLWEESLTLGEKFHMLLREIMEAARPLGEVLLDTLHSLMPAFESLIGILTSIMEKFGELPEPLQHAITYFLLFKATSNNTFGAVLSGAGKFLGLFGGQIGSFLGTIGAGGLSLKGIITGVFTAITSPVGLVIAALALVGFAAYKLITDFEGTKLFFQQWAMVVPSIFFGAIENILKIFNLLPKAWNKVMEVINAEKFKIDPFSGAIDWASEKRETSTDKFKEKKEERKQHKAKKKAEKEAKDLQKKADNIKIPKNRTTKEERIDGLGQQDIKKMNNFYDKKKKKDNEEEKRRKKMEQERLKAEKEAEKRALDAIKRRNKFLDETIKAHKDIVKSLKDYAGLFDKITNKQLRATNPYKLMRQAQMREKAYAQREQSLSILESRGVPKELMQQFREMGLNDLGNITGLAKLNNAQLAAWIRTQGSINNRIQREASDRVITQVRMGDIIIQTNTDDPRAYKKQVEKEVYNTFKSKGVEILSF